MTLVSHLLLFLALVILQQTLMVSDSEFIDRQWF